MTRATTRPPYAPWTLDEALTVIRDLQPRIKALGWHVALAGGVLNVGRSDKDLDLVFLPLQNTAIDPASTAVDTHELIVLLDGTFGKAQGGWSDASPTWEPCAWMRVQYGYQLANGQRIDVFIV